MGLFPKSLAFKSGRKKQSQSRNELVIQGSPRNRRPDIVGLALNQFPILEDWDKWNNNFDVGWKPPKALRLNV